MRRIRPWVGKSTFFRDPFRQAPKRTPGERKEAPRGRKWTKNGPKYIKNKAQGPKMNQKTQKHLQKKKRTSVAKTSRGPQREKQTPRYRRRAIPTKGAPGRGQGNKTDAKVRISFFEETEYAKRDTRKQTESCNKLKGTPRRSWDTKKHFKKRIQA